jgi:hypothetical protein
VHFSPIPLLAYEATVTFGEEPIPEVADGLQALICWALFWGLTGSEIHISPGGMAGKRAGLTNAYVF